MKKKTVNTLLVLCFTALACGCGYKSGSLLPAELKTIHIDNFTNEINIAQEVSDKRADYSYWPGMERQITLAVNDRLVYDSDLDVTSSAKADIVLKGALVDFRQYPLSYNDDEQVEERRIEIYVDMELYNNQTQETMWTEKRFMGYSTYDVIGPDAETEQQGINKAVDDLAQRILERVTEAW